MSGIILTQEQKDVIKKYLHEASEALYRIDSENAAFKTIVDVASEESGIAKKLVSRVYKSEYKQKVRELLEEAENIAFLTE